MQSAVFCYALQDAELARNVGAYLETNIPLIPLYDEGVVNGDRDLIDSVAGAISADIAIAILSPDSIPARWERARWEPVFLRQPAEFDSRLYFFLGRPCKFPELLRRQPFFDCSGSVLAGLRALKRHMFAARRWVDLPPSVADTNWDLEPLRIHIADRPGSTAGVPKNTALAFAHKFADEFEGTFWIDCAYRSAAGILGDTAHALGLTLTGSTEQNRSALISFCEQRRCLFLYDGLESDRRELVNFAGRSSLIAVAPGEIRPLLSLDETLRIFSRWTHDPETCLRHLGDAQTHLRTAMRLGPALVALLKHSSRLAEANEILDLLIAEASKERDFEALRELQWERSWILGHWGEPYDSAVLPVRAEGQTPQLGFNIG